MSKKMPNEMPVISAILAKQLIFNGRSEPFQHFTHIPQIKQHACKGCGDKFIFKSSFNDHINRQSLKIIYNCKVCGKPQSFFNRCTFLNHIKSHIDISSTINLNDLYVTSLTQTNFNMSCDFKEDEETISMETFEYLKKSKLIEIPSEEPDHKPSPSLFKQSLKPVSNVDAIINNINNSFVNALKESEADNLFVELNLQSEESNESFVKTNTPFIQSTEPSVPLNNFSIQSNAPLSQSNMPFVQLNGSFLQPKQPGVQLCQPIEKADILLAPAPIQSSVTFLQLNELNPTSVQPHIPYGSNGKKLIIKQTRNPKDLATSAPKVTIISNTILKAADKDLNSEQDTVCHNNSKLDIKPQDDKSNSCDASSCPFCSIKYQGPSTDLITAQENHFQEEKDKIMCQECQMFFMNKCSFHAHKAVHTLKPPFICPECGHKFYALYFFYKHIHGVCFHLSKVAVIPCPEERCKSYFPQSFLSQHFSLCHIASFFECVACKLQFSDEIKLSDHSKEEHSNENAQKVQYYRCKPCGEQLFKTLDEIQPHFEEKHEKRISLKYNLYTCPGCNKKFNAVVPMRKHAGTCVLYKNSMYGKYLDRNANASSKYKYNTEELPPNFVSNKCAKCNVISIQEVSTDASADIICMKCCVDNCEKNNRVITIGKKIKLKASPIGKEDQIQSKRKKPNHTKKIFIDEYELFISNSGENKKSASDNGNFFTCNICRFNSRDRIIFTNHIVSHRDDSAAYQCMDCGLCYVVKQSLSKHLKSAHNVLDTEHYIETHQSKIVECFERLEKYKLESAKNQCTECLESFQNATDLDKHFRSHGMAFIKLKQKNKSP